MSGFSVLLVITLTLAWFGLPFLPTIRELFKRTETLPLNVDRDHDGEIRHFARRFKTYLESNFQLPPFDERLARGTAGEGFFNDRTPYQIVERTGDAFLRMAQTAVSIPALTIFSGAIALPDRLRFPFGIYAAADIETGTDAVVRSLYGRQNVRLKEGTAVLRWIHADNELTVAAHSTLYGRASAERAIYLGPDVGFERLHAEPIVFDLAGEPTRPVARLRQVPALFRPAAKPMAKNCYSIDADLVVPPLSVLRGNFVVRGSIRIGRRARVEGSLKSFKDFHIEPDATITGSVVSGQDLEIGTATQIDGPAVASRHMKIGRHCRIGSAGRPTSAIAPSMTVAPGVVVYGTVWARESGRVEKDDAAN